MLGLKGFWGEQGTENLSKSQLGGLFASERIVGHERPSLRSRVRVSEQTLRRAIPVLICIFLIVFAIAAAMRLSASYDDALQRAGRELAASADAAVLSLRANAPMPPHLRAPGRVYAIIDRQGSLRAAWAGAAQMSAEDAGRIAEALKARTPGARGLAHSGFTGRDGVKVLVETRALGTGSRRLVVMQTQGAVLAGWSRDLSTYSTLFGVSGFVLLLLAYAYYWQSERAAAASGSLRATTNRLERALERGRCGLWDWDIGRGHFHWSASLFDMLGVQRRDGPIPFGEVMDRLHPDDRTLYEEVDGLLKSGGSAIDTDFRLRRADGEWLWLRARGELTRDEEGGNPRLIGITIDITEQKNADRRSDQAGRHLAQAIENISETFVLWDKANRLVLCNSKYQRFHGLSNAKIRPGTPYDEIAAACSKPEVRTRITGGLADGEEGSHYEIQHKDGRWFQINERRTEDGGFVSVGTDITVLKTHEERLMESERELRATIAEHQKSRAELERQTQELAVMADRLMMEKTRAEEASLSKTTFLANMSHELRTPLNAIIGFSEVMSEELFGDIGSDKYREYANDIRKSGRHLHDVIDAILDMSKIEAGRITLSVEKLDMGELIGECLRLVEPRAEENGLILKSRVRAGLVLDGDRRAVKQVLINLLSNAIKFTPAGGTVTLTAKSQNGELVVSVADTGIGIPTDEIEKLGRPFEQVENQFTRTRGGSGLGLAISRSLVELHGGSFRIDSKDGAGTTMTIALPKRAMMDEGGGDPEAE